MNIQLQDGQLAYAKFGEGKHVLLAFHGFGQDKTIFKSWAESLGKHYTLYAFDLFHHGESTRRYSKLSKKVWTDYLSVFFDKEDIDKCTILGFSLGGRFAIATALSFPKQVKKLILVAPDGIFLTIWFKLATHPIVRWLFKYLMFHPAKLDWLVAFNEKYRLVSTYLGDFVKKEMGSLENRKRVYISWNHFKSLGYSKKNLIRAFRKHSFERQIILGKKDHIIKPKAILPIIKQMGEFQVDILPLKHHQLIKPEVAAHIIDKKAKKEELEDWK